MGGLVWCRVTRKIRTKTGENIAPHPSSIEKPEDLDVFKIKDGGFWNYLFPSSTTSSHRR